MTRKRAAGLQYQSLGWYGEHGEQAHDMVVTPPAEYRGRYSVTALARLRREPPSLEVYRVTVSDREIGATLTFEAGGAALPGDLVDVKRLWRDSQYLAGWAQSQLGRPLETEARQAAIVEALRTADWSSGPPKARDVAARLDRLDRQDPSRPTRDFQSDVRGLGGWSALRERVSRDF